MKVDSDIRVCLIAKSFDLNIGGIGRYAKELYLRLKNKMQVKTISAENTSSIGYLWFSAIQVLFMLPKADIYHALSPIEAIHIYKKKNSVVTIHDLLPILYLDSTKIRYAKGPVGKFLAKRYFNFACKRAIECKKIIVNSELTKRHVVNYFKVEESKISVIPIGINSELKLIRHPRANKKYCIGTISYLDQKKRIDLLIKAFRELKRDDVELIIGGDGDDKDRLEELARGLNVKFLGFVPDEKLCEFYNSLDLFVFPSINEGQGLPIIEAIACGRLVITLKDAIIPEEIKSHTIIVKSEELSSKILNVKDCSPNQSDENIKWAQSHSLDEMTKRTIEIYDKLLE